MRGRGGGRVGGPGKGGGAEGRQGQEGLAAAARCVAGSTAAPPPPAAASCATTSRLCQTCLCKQLALPRSRPPGRSPALGVCPQVGIEMKFKDAKYPVIIAPTHVPEMNQVRAQGSSGRGWGPGRDGQGRMPPFAAVPAVLGTAWPACSSPPVPAARTLEAAGGWMRWRGHSSPPPPIHAHTLLRCPAASCLRHACATTC